MKQLDVNSQLLEALNMIVAVEPDPLRARNHPSAILVTTLLQTSHLEHYPTLSDYWKTRLNPSPTNTSQNTLT